MGRVYLVSCTLHGPSHVLPEASTVVEETPTVKLLVKTLIQKFVVCILMDV